MPLLNIQAGLGQLTRERRTGIGSFAQPQRWPRRHWLASSALATGSVLVLVAGVLAIWQPWQKCGRGMITVGSPYRCVGLNLDSTPFQAHDPVKDLEQMISSDNANIKEPYATIVLLENMTPDQAIDTGSVDNLRHDIAGALTAVRRANTSRVAGPTEIKIKLMLANPGSGNADTYWLRTVKAIKRSVSAEHIVAVTGIGVSMDQTRSAVAALADDHDQSIATVGSLVTADNMNTDLTGNLLHNFVRVAPTNSDEVHGAANYIHQHKYGKILLVKDNNSADSYAKTLAQSFSALPNIQVSFTKAYTSPPGRLAGTTRKDIVANQFSDWADSICPKKPDLIYFAGRGVDLGTFLTVMSSSHCGTKALLITGDDASTLVNQPLPYSDFVSSVVYTGLATRDEWNGRPQDETQLGYYTTQRGYYKDFTVAFAKNGFAPEDLDDGNAMMNYDATLTAITAARRSESTRTNPSTVAIFLHNLNCNKAIHGISGNIAISENGNPIDKPMPILQIHSDGTQTLEEIVWPDGKPPAPC